MSGYETGLLWGFIVGAPLMGAAFWAGKALLDLHFEERARQVRLPVRSRDVRLDNSTARFTPSQPLKPHYPDEEQQ